MQRLKSIKVQLIIYDHIIRGSNKEGNSKDFEEGLKNHFAELNIKNSKAEIKTHYFDFEGTYNRIIESTPLN